jgi:hypothetical protein
MTISQFAPPAGWPRQPRAGASGPALALLGALAVALGAAFVLAPGVLAASAQGGGYAGQRALIAATRTAFVGYWAAGHRAYSPGLEHLIDYWTRYHAAKAVIAALLLAVLLILGKRLWVALLGAGRLSPWRVAALASSVALVAVLAATSAAVVIANIQGAVAPFASLISLLPLGSHDKQLVHTLGQVRPGLAAYPGAGGRTTPPLEAMISDFALYHAAAAALTVAVAVILIVLSVVSWKRRARTRSSERRARNALALAGVSSAALALVILVIAAANLGNAMNPAPALLAFFTAGPGGL